MYRLQRDGEWGLYGEGGRERIFRKWEAGDCEVRV